MQINLPSIKTPYTRYPTYGIKVPSVVDNSLDMLIQHKIKQAQYAQQQQAVGMRTPTVLTDPLLNLRVRDYYRQKYTQSIGSEIAGRAVGAVEGAALGGGIGAAIGAAVATLVGLVAVAEPTPVGEAVAATVIPALTAGTAAATTAATGAKIGGAIGAGVGGAFGAIHADYSTWYATKDMFTNLYSPNSIGEGVLNTLTFVGRSMDLIGPAAAIKSTLLSLITGNDLQEIIANAYGLGDQGQMDVDFTHIREALDIDLGGVGNFIFDLAGEMVIDPGNWKNVINLTGNVSHIGRKMPYLNPKLKNIKDAVMESTDSFVKEVSTLNPRVAKSFYKAIEQNDPYKMYAFLKKNTALVGLPEDDAIEALRLYANSINKSAYKSLGSQVYSLTESLDSLDDFMTSNLVTTAVPAIAGIKAFKYLSNIPLIGNSTALDYAKKFFQGNMTKFNDFNNEGVKHTIEGFKKFFYGDSYAEHTSFKSWLIDIRDKSEFDSFKNIINKYNIKSPQRLMDLLEQSPNDPELLLLKDEYIKYITQKLDVEISKIKKGEGSPYEIRQSRIKAEEYQRLLEELSEDPVYRVARKKLQKHMNIIRKIHRLSSSTKTNNVHKSLKDIYKKEFAKAVEEIMSAATSEDKALRELALAVLNVPYKGLSSFIRDNMEDAIKQQLDLFYNTEAEKFYDYVIKSSPKFKESFIKNMTKQINKLHSKGLIDEDTYQKFLTASKSGDIDSQFTNIKKIIEDSEYQHLIKEDKRTFFVKAKSKSQDMFLEQRRWEFVLQKYGVNNIQLKDGTKLKNIYQVYQKMPTYNFKITDHIQKTQTLEFYDKMFNLINKSIVDLQYSMEELDEVASVNTDPLEQEVFNDVYESYHILLGDIYFATPEGGSMIRTAKLIYRMATGELIDEDRLIKAFKVVLDKKVMFNKTSGNFNRYEKVYKQLKKYYDSIISGKITVKEFYTFKTRQKLIKLYNEIQALCALDVVQFKKSTERLADTLTKGIKKLKNELSRKLSQVSNETEAKKIQKYTTEIQELEHKINVLEEVSFYYGNSKDSFISVFDYYKGDSLHVDPTDIIINSLYNKGGLGTQLAKYGEELVNTSFEAGVEVSNKINNVFRKIYNLISLGNESAPELFKSFRSMFNKIWTDVQLPLDQKVSQIRALIDSFGESTTKVEYIKSKGFSTELEIIYDNKTNKFKVNYTESKYIPFNNLLKVIVDPPQNNSLQKIFKQRVATFIQELSKDQEQLLIFAQSDPDNYSIIKNIIGDTPKEIQINRLVSYLTDLEIGNKFVDLYQNGRKSSAIIRRSSRYNEFAQASPFLSDHKIVLFDVETTGSKSNGVYSISYSTYENGNWNKQILFTKMDPSWEIDPEVDRLNGGVGSTAKKIMEAKDATHDVFDTPQQMFEYLKTQLSEDTILVAHNARFDYSQIMNSLSGNKLFDANGQVDDELLEEFAKNNFDYTFVDSQKLVTLFFATGKNLNKLTNIEVAKASGLDTILVFKDLKGKITYIYNNELITPDEFLKIKDSSLLMEFDAVTNTTKASYKGGDLHEASTDISLMESWSKVFLENFKEMNLELKDLDESMLYQDKLMTKHLNALRKGEIDGYNYKQNIEDIYNILDEYYNLYVGSGGEYSAQEFVANHITDLIKNIDEVTNYDMFYAYLDELEDFIIKHQDEIEDLLYDRLKTFIDDLIVLDDNFANKVNTIKEMRSGAVVGNFKVNEIYVAYRLSNTLKNSPSMNKLKALFENRQELSDFLEGANEKELAAQIANDPMFDAIRKELNDIENSVNWFIKFLDNLEPEYYDLYKNIKQTLEQEKLVTDPTRKFLLREKLKEDIALRVKNNNLSQLRALELFDDIDANLDNFVLPDANTISRLYQTIRMNFIDGLTNTKFKYVDDTTNEAKALVKFIDDLITDIEDSFQEIRLPLIEAKQLNRMYRRQGMTLAELNEVSVIDKKFANQLQQNKNFEFIAKDLEDKFENGVHRLMPWEAVKYNSSVVIEYNKNIQSGMSLKKLINQIERQNFVKEESQSYKALPIVDLEHSRLGQLYTLAANCIDGGADLNSFINDAYRANFLNLKSNYKNIRLVEMCNTLWNSLLSGTVLPEEIGLNPIVFKQFVNELSTINEVTFSYLKDPGLLKQRLINALMYNTYIKNSEIFNSTADTLIKYPDSVDEQLMTAYKYAEQISSTASYTSSKNFNEVYNLFTDSNGNFNIKEFKQYFINHPEMTLVVYDNTGVYKRLNTNNEELLQKVVESKNQLPFTIMSVNDYKALTNNQKISLPPVLKWMQQHILTPVKKLSLAFSFPFMIKNAFTAAYMTLITSESKFNLPLYFKYLGQTISDNHRYNHIYASLLTSKTMDDFTHSFGDKEKYWVTLLDNSNFMSQLKLEDEDLFNYISKLTPEQKLRLAELNDIVHTPAAYGQINELTKYNEIEKKREYNAKIAEERLKDPSKLDPEDIELYEFQLGIRKYQGMGIKQIKSRLNELNSYKILSSKEHQEKSILESIVKRHNNKRSNAIFKWTGAQAFLNFNNNIETVLRSTAIRLYMDEGMTFDEATLKVIDTQFTYDNKSMAEQLTEFAIPFISYPIRMANLATELTKDGTIMDAVYWTDYYSWDEESEQQQYSDFLTRRRAQGDTPIGDKLLSLANPIQESLFMLHEPTYSFNNKLNPLLKPAVDMVTESEYVRWNHLPVISQVTNVTNLVSEGKFTMINDYYRYNQFGNYYLPRINNRIGGTIYNKLYTKGGYSKVSMNMSPLTSSNLKYRVNDILYNSGPTNTRK